MAPLHLAILLRRSYRDELMPDPLLVKELIKGVGLLHMGVESLEADTKFSTYPAYVIELLKSFEPSQPYPGAALYDILVHVGFVVVPVMSPELSSLVPTEVEEAER